MNYIDRFEKYLTNINENQDVLNRFKTYSFDNKIKQNKEYTKRNALNIKECIHKACEWTGDKSSFIFLFEIAIAETNLGVSNKSMATRGDIGRSVWHIDEGTFKDTKTSPKLKIYRDRLKKYGLDWTIVDWNDLSLNLLLGAIGAKMVLLLKGINYNFSSNLKSLKNRASQYSTKYNGGGSSEAETNYVNNCKAWYTVLLQQGAEYLEFNGKKYDITKNGLSLNDNLV